MPFWSSNVIGVPLLGGITAKHDETQVGLGLLLLWSQSLSSSTSEIQSKLHDLSINIQDLVKLKNALGLQMAEVMKVSHTLLVPKLDV